MTEQLAPRGTIQASLTCLTALVERVQLFVVRFAGDDHHLRRRQQLRRQLRRAEGDDGVAVPVQVEEVARLRIVEEVMRLIQQNPVWESGTAPQMVDSGKRRPDVGDLLVLRQSR